MPVDLWTKAPWEIRRSIVEQLGIELSPEQLDVISSDARLRLAAGGERGGKSFVSGLDLTTRLPWGMEYWLIGPDYYLPRAEFDYVEEHLAVLGAIRSKRDVAKPKEGSWVLSTKTGQQVVTRTAADVRKLASRSVSGILLCEAGQLDYDVFLKAIGRVSQERGWILASGTFESSYDWYANTWRDWHDDPDNLDGGVAYSIPTWSNLVEFPGGRYDKEILRLENLYRHIPGYFEEKCGAVPAAPLGVIFRMFSVRKHVQEIAYSDRSPVWLAIDPSSGGASAYAICACQFFPDPNASTEDPLDFCHVVDVMYVPGADFDIIAPMVRNKPWFPNVAGGAIDVEAPDERKRWATHLGVPLASKKVPIFEGERRLQTFIYFDDDTPAHLIFNADATPGMALSEFTQYRNPIDDPAEQEGKPSSTPGRRTGPEHMLKALWYLLYIRYGPVRPAPAPVPIVRSSWGRLRHAFNRR